MGLFGKKRITNPISKVKLLGMRTAQQTMTFSTANFSIYSFWVVYENGATKTIEVSPENPMDKSGKEKALFDKLMSYANDELSGNSGTQSAVSSADMLDELKKLKELFDSEIVVPTVPFPKMRLADIYKELEERYDYKVEDSEKNDLTTEAERLTYKLAKEKFNSEFLFVTDFPAEKRAFYHMRDKDGILQGYDLIWRGVEITTGAQREHRYEEIVKNAKEKGLGEDVKFYLDFFKHGCPPHGGFAIGVDRLTMLLLGIPSVKESQFLFRGPNRLNP